MKWIDILQLTASMNLVRKFSALLTLLSCLVAFSAPGFAQNRDEVVYFHNDALGSAVAAVNESGDLCWRQTYSPYGEQTSTEDRTPPVGCGLLGNERGYTGHTQDRSGLVYMQQRYYDPGLGRFLSIDPSGVNANDPRTLNRYMYAANNPYKYKDPDGRIVFLALVPVALKALDIAVTAAEITAAAKTGGASAVAGVLAESAATSLFPGGKVASRIVKKFDDIGPGDGYIFRGVHADHPDIDNAKKGKVTPGNPKGTVSAEDHNKGGHQTDSQYTSWTHNYDVAKSHAEKNGEGGRILYTRPGAPGANDTWSWHRSEDIFSESEVLLRGERSGLNVLGND